MDERKEKILAVITEFGAKLAQQPEVIEAVHDQGQPLWERLSVCEVVFAFEQAFRDHLVIEGKTDEHVQPLRDKTGTPGAYAMPPVPAG